MFLSSLVPVLRGNSSVQVQITPDAAGVRIVVIPTLDKAQPDTNDQTLADLQALLSRPFVFKAPIDADLDQQCAEAMRGLAATRSTAVDALDGYRTVLAEAAEAARKATADKAPKKALPVKPTASKASDDSAPKATPAAKPEPEVTKGASLAADLFS